MSFKTDKWKQPEPSGDEVLRALPHALGPEKSVLSTLLVDSQEFIPLAIEENLSPAHFYLPNHAILFEVLLEIFASGKEIELVSLIQHLLDRGLLGRVGGPSAVTDIYTYAPSPRHFKQHIAHLQDKFKGREILRISNEGQAAVYDSPDAVDETLERMERELMAIRDTDSAEKPQTVRQAAGLVIDDFQAELKHEPSAKGISTGFEELDRATNGLKPGEMTVIGARPSVGKTACMMNIAEHVCIGSGVPTLVFSAEMTTKALTKRMIFSRAKFDMNKLSRGYAPTKGDLLRIQRAAIEVADAKMHFDDSSGPTISYIRAKARRMKREHDIGLICIDYLGLIKSVSKQSQFSREREIAEISAGVKGMAKDLGIPVILLAQLNRDVEKRPGKGAKSARPRMSDLKDSGSIEADADVIGLLSRDSYQAGEDPDAIEGLSCLDLVKNRNGPTGPISLTFIAELMRFESGAPRREPEPQQQPARPSRFES